MARAHPHGADLYHLQGPHPDRPCQDPALLGQTGGVGQRRAVVPRWPQGESMRPRCGRAAR
jgi:hypothetical protein